MQQGLPTLLFLAVLLIAAAVAPVTAAQCNPSPLLACAAAARGAAPTAACCAAVEQQQPCFCTYLSNPNYSRFVNPSIISRITSYCDVAYPSC